MTTTVMKFGTDRIEKETVFVGKSVFDLTRRYNPADKLEVVAVHYTSYVSTAELRELVKQFPNMKFDGFNSKYIYFVTDAV